MTPGARVATAIELLDQIFAGDVAEKTLTTWGRQNRFAGSKDRAAIRDLVFQGLRCRTSYAALGGALTGRGVMIGAIQSSEISLEDIFTGQGYAPAALSPQEAALLRCPNDLSYAERLDVPNWLEEELRSDLGNDLFPVSQMFKERASLFLRVNPHKGSVDNVIAHLAADGIETRPAKAGSNALEVLTNARRVKTSQAYLTGLCEIQDVSSQVLVEELSLAPGMRVLDYCAGGGGKTLAMAAGIAMGAVQLFAHDAAPARMRDLPARAARAGINVTQLTTDEIADHAPFDLVLIDVPCSGSGTWRRSPDSKWRLKPEDLFALCKTQAEILDTASALLGPNGMLAYATCSLLRRENEDQIDRFLARTASYVLHSERRFSPLEADGDGFFLAELRKKDL